MTCTMTQNRCQHDHLIGTCPYCPKPGEQHDRATMLIQAFGARCEAAEYTCTGEAHDLLASVSTILAEIRAKLAEHPQTPAAGSLTAFVEAYDRWLSGLYAVVYPSSAEGPGARLASFVRGLLDATPDEAGDMLTNYADDAAALCDAIAPREPGA